MKFLKWLTAVAGIVCLCSAASFSQTDDLLSDFSTDVVQTDNIVVDSDSVSDAEPVASQTNTSATAADILNVRLQNDGKLSGRLLVLYPTGKSEPADAKVAFSRDGAMVETSRTDESGHFHVAGLQPGEYIATASVGEASTDFQVRILEFDPNADPDEMFLEGTLTPLPQGDVMVDGGLVEGALAGDCGDCGGVIAEPLYGDEVVGDFVGGDIISEPIMDGGFVMDGGCMDGACGYATDMGCCGASTGGYFEPVYGCSGGGGGGGFGLGGLLGVGGLAAGITALAIDDDDVVSPAAP